AAYYESDEVETVPPALRKRFFARSGNGYRLEREAASLVTFAQANLIANPFPVRGRFDAVFCRNVMIYFDRPTQQYVVSKLVERITPGGYLVIGHSESVVATHLPRGHATVGVYRIDPSGGRGTSSAAPGHFCEQTSPRGARSASSAAPGHFC